MNSVLTNQEPMALISYMETYLKHTTPDITLFSEEKFEIAVHKEIFYQTQLMRTMIRSANPDHCCSKVSLTCLIPRKDLEMIVQFLYSGVAFCRNQTEANTLSENLKELFGFPQICSISNIEPISKLETTLNSQSPKSSPKKPRKPASVSIGDEFEVDIASIKTETTDLFDKTNLMEPSDRKKSRKQSLTTASIRNEFFEETFVTKNETKEGSNEAHFNAEDITDPLSSEIKDEDSKSEIEIKDEDSKSKIGCTICNKRFISKFSLAKHVYQKHKDACSVCFRKFESRQDMKAHISNHPLSDFHMTTRCFFCDISYGKGKINKSKFKEHMKSEHNVGYECPICQMKWSSVSKLKQHKIQEHNLTKRNSIGKYKYFNVVDITDPLASEIQTFSLHCNGFQFIIILKEYECTIDLLE